MTIPRQPETAAWPANVVPIRPEGPADTPAVDFDAFYTANVSQLAAVLGATLNDREVGADAAAEAMVRACERWSKVSVHPNPMGWCYRVGLNWATSRWRRRRRETTTDPANLHHLPATSPPEINHVLRRAVMQLPVDQRSVVVLKYWLGWSGAEIADALNIAPGTVGSRLNRALTALRSHAAGARHD